MNAQIVKICSMGLKPSHLGKTIAELRDFLQTLKHFNPCGEGGEYESAVFDCPLFKTHRIVAKKQETVMHEDNDISPVAYLRYSELDVEEKPAADIARDQAFMDALIASSGAPPTDHLTQLQEAES